VSPTFVSSELEIEGWYKQKDMSDFTDKVTFPYKAEKS